MKVDAYKHILLMSVIFLFGCQTTAPNLSYVSHMKQNGLKSAVVCFKTFEDKRPENERGVIGTNPNNFGSGGMKQYESPNLVETIKGAIASELQNAGYTLSDSANDLTVNAELRMVLCDVLSQTTTARVKIKMKVFDKGKQVLDYEYSSQKKNVSMLLPMSCEDAIVHRVSDVLSEFIHDLDEYIKS